MKQNNDKKAVRVIMAGLCMLPLVLGLPELLPAAKSEGKKIIVNISKFRNNRGDVRVALFNSAKGFPRDRSEIFRGLKQKIQNKRARVVFTNVPPGTYAISAFHDEDTNGKLETGLFGIPQEGYATSNNARGKMGPPDFEDARFRVRGKTVIQNIHMHY